MKKLLIVALIMLSAFAADAQVSAPGGYDWRDSSVVPPARMQQHFEFMNNQYNFPAQPRSQWELGVKVGTPTVNGDVDAVFPGVGFGVHARKSLGYLVSLRGEYSYGVSRGLGERFINVPTTLNPAWSAYPSGKLYYNYKTSVSQFLISGIISLNNISFHKAEPKALLYGLFGAGFMIYDTKLDALNGSTPYNFSEGMSKANIRAMLDGSYETNAVKFGNRLKPTLSLGFGAQFKISNKVNISIEDRVSFSKDDYLDGVKYYYPVSTTGARIAAITPQYDAINFLSLGININLF
jgi:hypothetical protein